MVYAMIRYFNFFTFALAILFPIITFLTCRSNNILDIRVPDIYQKWIHSYEEDYDEYIVFRNSTYEFPPARGRVFFEFFEDGNLSYGNIELPTGNQEKNGSWRKVSSDIIEVIVDKQNLKIQIINLSKDKLIIKYLNN